MRIIIDAQPLLEPLAGIGRYTRSLLETLAEIDSDNTYFLYYGASLRQSRANLPHFDNPNFHNKLIRFSGKSFRFLTEKLHLFPVGSFLRDYDIYHGVNYYVPNLPFPSIVNIYDLSCVLFPHCFTRERLRDIRYKMNASVKRADKIITGSEAAKADIVNCLNVAEDRIEVLPLGVKKMFHPVDDKKLTLLKKKYWLPERFILFVGTIEPRKNILKLVHAFHRIDRDMSLVIAGRKGWLFEEIFEEVKKLNLGERIIFLDFVPEHDLPFLFSAASVFVYPSLYEGFGLPPLEAMACGVPVITSNRSSLPEIVGEAGILINPEDAGEIGEAIISVLDNDSMRQEMIRKGLERAKTFSWERCARETLSLYQKIK